MKQLCFFLIAIPFFSFSQKSFAPLGAEWNYEGSSEFHSPEIGCTGSHFNYVVEEELIIDNKDCSLIRAYHSTNLDTVFRFTGDSLIVWEDGDQIYFQQDSSFLLLFDFGAEMGDTIVRFDPFNRGAFSGTSYLDTDTTANELIEFVSEVSEVLIDGQNLKIQNVVSLDPDFSYITDLIIEGIGSTSESFSGFYFITLANGCDGELICYSNDMLNYETPNNFAPVHPNCDYNPLLDSVDDHLEDDSITIFPNPFNTIIEVEADTDILLLRIIGLDGRVVLSVSNQDFINTGAISSGSYLIQVITTQGAITKKIIKF
jgi:hypothetical protein